MPSGGERQGTPGAAYPQRTDLQAPKPLAPVAPPSQQYGQAVASIRAQQVVPMAAAPPAPVPLSTAASGGPGPPPGPAAPPPVPLDAPSHRPNEPVTAGLPIGAGPGTEALGSSLGPPSPQTTGAFLSQLAGQNPDLAYLAAIANSGRR